MTAVVLSEEERALLRRKVATASLIGAELVIAAVEDIVAVHTADLQETLDSCREQRADLLELLKGEREDAEPIVDARVAEALAPIEALAEEWATAYGSPALDPHPLALRHAAALRAALPAPDPTTERGAS
jgi:hypothetical protein